MGAQIVRYVLKEVGHAMRMGIFVRPLRTVRRCCGHFLPTTPHTDTSDEAFWQNYTFAANLTRDFPPRLAPFCGKNTHNPRLPSD